MCDDFEDFEAERDILENTWKKTIDGINKDGYRAGIDAGQEECLQEGFNATFKLSSTLLFAISELRGVISGKLSYNLMKPGSLTPDQERLLQTLLGDIVEYETELLKFSTELYAHLKEEEETSCKTGAENNFHPATRHNDKLISRSDADDKNLISVNEDNPADSGSCVTKFKTADDSNSVSELTECETDNTSPEIKINQFKSRLQTILASGS